LLIVVRPEYHKRIVGKNEAAIRKLCQTGSLALILLYAAEPMKILILSIHHNQQLVPLKDHLDYAAIRERTEKLRALVKGLVDKGGIDLICEESDPCYVSIAQEEAFLHKPRIPWKNINMTSQERLEAGIWEALLYRPQDIDNERGVRIDHRIPEDDTREHFFKDEIIRTAIETKAKAILVLCGDAHTEALSAKLKADGHDVDTNHDLIAEKNWK
jgi:hypothetical protein